MPPREPQSSRTTSPSGSSGRSRGMFGIRPPSNSHGTPYPRVQTIEGPSLIPFPPRASSNRHDPLRGRRLPDQNGCEGLQPITDILPDLDRQEAGFIWPLRNSTTRRRPGGISSATKINRIRPAWTFMLTPIYISCRGDQGTARSPCSCRCNHLCEPIAGRAGGWPAFPSTFCPIRAQRRACRAGSHRASSRQPRSRAIAARTAGGLHQRSQAAGRAPACAGAGAAR